MGGPMSARLLAAVHQVVVFDNSRSAERRERRCLPTTSSATPASVAQGRHRRGRCPDCLRPPAPDPGRRAARRSTSWPPGPRQQTGPRRVAVSCRRTQVRADFASLRLALASSRDARAPTYYSFSQRAARRNCRDATCNSWPQRASAAHSTADPNQRNAGVGYWPVSDHRPDARPQASAKGRSATQSCRRAIFRKRSLWIRLHTEELSLLVRCSATL